jgi:hypothetical protein
MNDPLNRKAITGLDLARRYFLRDCGYGLGKIALAGLLASSTRHESHAAISDSPLAVRQPHFPPTAKRVIHLFMTGAPSQLELFDQKPLLKKLEGKPLPPSVIGDQRYAFIRSDASVLGPRFAFSKHGECGAEISDMLPHLAKVVDDICLIRSVHTDQFNHAPAQLFFNTGFGQPGQTEADSAEEQPYGPAASCRRSTRELRFAVRGIRSSTCQRHQGSTRNCRGTHTR